MDEAKLLTKTVKSKIILAVSGKGGTGKTTLAAGVASCLAALGHPTALLDADIGLRNADIVLGLSDKAVMDFGDVLDGRAGPDDALIAHPLVDGLHVMPAPPSLREVDGEAFARLAGYLRERFHFIWIDGPAGCSRWIEELAALADVLVVVATPDVSSIRDAGRMAELLDAHSGYGCLVINRVRPHMIKRSGAMLVDEIMDETGLPLLGMVPEDERVIVAGNKGLPLVCLGQDGAAAAYRNIALRLLGQRVPLGDMRVTSRAKGGFMRRVIKAFAN